MKTLRHSTNLCGTLDINDSPFKIFRQWVGVLPDLVCRFGRLDKSVLLRGLFPQLRHRLSLPELGNWSVKWRLLMEVMACDHSQAFYGVRHT